MGEGRGEGALEGGTLPSNATAREAEDGNEQARGPGPEGVPEVFDYGVEEVFGKDRHRKMVRRFLPRCELDRKAEGELRTSFGKAAAITDAEERELPAEELLESSVARADIEGQFKWLKDRYVVSLKPMWVRHDASVPGHMFVCVMGLMLLRYLQWEARASGSL